MRARGAVWLLAGFVALTLFAATRSTLWDRDEARFAEAASEMAAGGNFLYPTFNGALRPDKPALPYWIMAVAIRALGRTELAVRLGSCFAAALAAAATAAAARRLLGRGAGFWSAALLVSSPLFLLEACAATADAMLLASLAVAMFASVRLVEERGRARDAALFAAAVAAAALTKGPVGVLLPALAIAGTLAAGGPAIPARRRIAAAAAIALLAGVGAFALWFVPANAATGGRYLAEGLGRHAIGRALHPMEGHGGAFLRSLPYYVPVLLFGFAPGLLFLPGAASAAAEGRLGGPAGRAILVGWTAPAFLFFSLAATKLPHYILPVLPPLAIAAGGTIVADRGGALAPRDRTWLSRGAFLFLAVAVVEAAALGAVARALPFLRAPALGLAAIVAGASALAVRSLRRGRLRAAAAALVAGTAGAFALASIAVLPALERWKPVAAFARRVRAEGPSAPAATYGFEEPSLDFYLDRSPIERLRAPADVRRWATGAAPALLVTTRAALQSVAPRDPRLTEIASARGFDYSKGEDVELVALLRPGR